MLVVCLVAHMSEWVILLSLVSLILGNIIFLLSRSPCCLPTMPELWQEQLLPLWKLCYSCHHGSSCQPACLPIHVSPPASVNLLWSSPAWTPLFTSYHKKNFVWSLVVCFVWYKNLTVVMASKKTGSSLSTICTVHVQPKQWIARLHGSYLRIHLFAPFVFICFYIT